MMKMKKKVRWKFKTYALCLASASASSPLKLGQYNQRRRDPTDESGADNSKTNNLEQNNFFCIFGTEQREDVTRHCGVVFLRAGLVVILSAHHNGDCHPKVGTKSVHEDRATWTIANQNSQRAKLKSCQTAPTSTAPNIE